MSKKSKIRCGGLIYLTSFVLVLSLAGSVSAAMITWDSAFDVVGPEDVTATGILHEAINGSSVAGQVVVNGVTFTNSDDLLGNSSGGDFLAGSTTGDADYDALLNKLDYGGGTSTTISMGGGTLIPGANYMVQVWFTDLRSAYMNRVMTFGDGLGNTVDVHASTGGLGQYTMGTFNADATGSQTLSLITNGFGNAHITAYQLRAVSPPTKASNPNPDNGETDVPRDDVVLMWGPGEFAAMHDVYLGTSFDDINDATTDSAAYQVRQSETTYALDRLKFGQAYYWRVDEVNAPPTSHIEFKGEVWQFTTEPIAYPIAGENITATASSTHQADTGPENTINGLGLDVNDLHSIEAADMWLSSDEPNAWIEYELDKVYKLHEMWVWNSNQMVESLVGLGLKDVTIEYSTNGTDYTTLGTTHEFARAPGAVDYAHNTTVDFNGVTASTSGSQLTATGEAC